MYTSRIKGLRKKFVVGTDIVHIGFSVNVALILHEKLVHIDKHEPDFVYTYQSIADYRYSDKDATDKGYVARIFFILRDLGVIDYRNREPLKNSYKLVYKGPLEPMLRELYARENILAFKCTERYISNKKNVLVRDYSNDIRFVKVKMMPQEDGSVIAVTNNCSNGIRHDYLIRPWNGNELESGERYWEKTFEETTIRYSHYVKQKKKAVEQG